MHSPLFNLLETRDLRPECHHCLLLSLPYFCSACVCAPTSTSALPKKSEAQAQGLLSLPKAVSVRDAHPGEVCWGWRGCCLEGCWGRGSCGRGTSLPKLELTACSQALRWGFGTIQFTAPSCNQGSWGTSFTDVA